MSVDGALPLHAVCCPVCDRTGPVRVIQVPDRDFHIPGEFWIVRCSNCGHCYMDPAPTPEAIPLCYPSGYAPHQTDETGTQSQVDRGESNGREIAAGAPADGSASSLSPTTAAHEAVRTPWYLSRFARSIPGLRALYYWLSADQSQPFPKEPGAGRRALEIGCGAGKFLVTLRDAGWQAEGLDLVPAAVSAARAKGFAVHEGILESLHATDGAFDAVFGWHVLEHVPRPRETLREIRRILKPGGYLGLSMPNFGSWERNVFGRHWSSYELPRHLQHFTPAILRRLLQEEGFADVRIIHQANIFSALGSCGYLLTAWFGERGPGPRVLKWYFNAPPLPVSLVLSAFAKLQAALRQAGRISATARRGDAPQ